MSGQCGGAGSSHKPILVGIFQGRLARLGVNFCDGRFESDEPFYSDSTFLLVFDSMGCTAKAVRRIPMQPRRGKLQYLSEKGPIKREPSDYSQSRAVAMRWVRRKADSEQGNRSHNQVRFARAKRCSDFHVPRTNHSPDYVEGASRAGRTGHGDDPRTRSGGDATPSATDPSGQRCSSL